ncbi:MAG: peptide chain release factor N(5)-glutamine methyltransferase [Bacilli bacterium]
MKKVNELINKYQNIIKKYEKDENVIFTLIEYLTGIYRSELFLKSDIEIDEALLKSYIDMYCSGKSIQYITNTAYFLGREFYVDENVLIPRFETEEVVLKAIEVIKKYDIKKIYEVGSGSGVIAITLNLECGVAIDSVDISPSAVSIAKKNNNNLRAKANFFLGNIMDGIEDQYEMIISNPPYIPNDGFVATETLENEPSLALFGGDDGLDFYRAIINDAVKLENIKFIVFEIGFNQRKAIEQLWRNTEIFQDINGNDRIAVLDMRR